FAQLVEQARVLDGNHGLLRKIAYQLDLLIGEGTDFLAIDANDSKELLLLEHRHRHHGTKAGQFNGSDKKWIAIDVSLLGRDIHDLSNLLRACSTAGASIRGWAD